MNNIHQEKIKNDKDGSNDQKEHIGTLEVSDSSLISQYLNNDDNAMRRLIDRHYATIYNRFRRETGNAEDAEDLAQQLWLQIAKNLHRYEDRGKFTHYLSSVATNLIKVHWRSVSTRQQYFDDSGHSAAHNTPEDICSIDPAQQVGGDEAVQYLSEKLIPGLPPEQRMAWLLRHESEYWEAREPLKWQQLAELNGLSISEAWNCFERAREEFMTQASCATDIDAEDVTVFLVWTQAQRAVKEQHFSWGYFANLLKVPENTMKTRYRAAQQQLASGLAKLGVV